MLHLIKMWLTVAVAERDEKGDWRYTASQGKGTCVREDLMDLLIERNQLG
jgi:hypothetical protein